MHLIVNCPDRLAPMTNIVRNLLFSEYTVNATDVDELRRSQRRLKSSKKGRPTSNNDSEDDLDLDDEDEASASTPNAESADKNFMSSLSVRYLIRTVLVSCTTSVLFSFTPN